MASRKYFNNVVIQATQTDIIMMHVLIDAQRFIKQNRMKAKIFIEHGDIVVDCYDKDYSKIQSLIDKQLNLLSEEISDGRTGWSKD